MELLQALEQEEARRKCKRKRNLQISELNQLPVGLRLLSDLTQEEQEIIDNEEKKRQKEKLSQNQKMFDEVNKAYKEDTISEDESSPSSNNSEDLNKAISQFKQHSNNQAQQKQKQQVFELKEAKKKITTPTITQKKKSSQSYVDLQFEVMRKRLMFSGGPQQKINEEKSESSSDNEGNKKGNNRISKSDWTDDLQQLFCFDKTSKPQQEKKSLEELIVEFPISAQRQNQDNQLNIIREQQRKFEEEKKKKERFENRKNIDGFIRIILNLDLIDIYSLIQPNELPIVPQQFSEGHSQYLKVWEKLFLNEIYNIIVNSKRSVEFLSFQEISKRRQKDYEWQGFLIKSNEEGHFVNARLYDKMPSINIEGKSQQDNGGEFSPIRSLKESDLIIISKEKLTNGNQDIKKLINADWLKSNLIKESAMFAYIHEKSKKGSIYAEVKIDLSKGEYLKIQQEIEQGYVRVYCYFIESLSTSIREYKTLRMSEFYGLTDTILMPSSSITPFNEYKLHKLFNNMQKFIGLHGNKFNISQLSAMQEVARMNNDKILLIQGPPGTGKTHTITGIISMLLVSGVDKILVCAPSNAAIDEIVSRINLKGLIGVELDQNALKEILLRIGSMDYEPSPAVKPHTLDQRLVETMNSQLLQDNRVKLNDADELLSILKKGIVLRLDDKNHFKYLQSVVNPNIKKLKDFLKKNDTLFEQKKQILYFKERLMAQLSKIKQSVEDNKLGGGDWRYQENSLILKSKIVCATLSMSGVEKLDIAKDKFEYLIVDEACQCIEPSTLIPLELGPKRVILVGDQKQLPATTFSENSDKLTKFSRSFFERLVDNGYQKFMLQIQYRMHPLIRQFPSKQFYENKISDDTSVVTRSLPQLIKLMDQWFQRLTFLDLGFSQESSEETSKQNKDEASCTLSLIQFIYKHMALKTDLGYSNLKSKIGIITPYKSQVRVLKDLIGPWLRNMGGKLYDIEINTVDAFQGREKDIIIINCVRSNSSSGVKGSLGFLVDERRMNVAITRAKHFLFVIGNSKTLNRDPVWKEFVSHCMKTERCYHKFDNSNEFQEQSLISLFQQQSDHIMEQSAINNKRTYSQSEDNAFEQISQDSKRICK